MSSRIPIIPSKVHKLPTNVSLGRNARRKSGPVGVRFDLLLFPYATVRLFDVERPKSSKSSGIARHKLLLLFRLSAVLVIGFASCGRRVARRSGSGSIFTVSRRPRGFRAMW